MEFSHTFLTGPAGTGKTTRAVEHLRGMVQAGLQAVGILVLAPQRSLLRPYQDVLNQADLLAYVGLDLSPALLGVGYIVGLNIAILVFAGGVISWWIAIPIYAAIHGLPEAGSAVDAATLLWKDQIRYLGVGAMCVGGFWALIQLRGQLLSGGKSGLAAFKSEQGGGGQQVELMGSDHGATDVPRLADLFNHRPVLPGGSVQWQVDAS